jgi:hypothetical protein
MSDSRLFRASYIACTDGQPRSNEHLIFYLKERRESVSYTHVQSRQQDAACDLEFMATVKLFTMVVILALDKTTRQNRWVETVQSLPGDRGRRRLPRP